MKRRHKVTAGAGAVIVAVSGLLFGAWDRFTAWQAAHLADDSQAEFHCEVAACEARGGHWWKGNCRGDR